MKYITGNYALNLECSLDTSGDWHQSCLDWGNIPLKESEGSIFGDYGIEESYNIPFHEGKKFFVANHLRAILDKIDSGNFLTLKGFYQDFICTDKYNNEFFNKIYLLKNKQNWKDISDFISKEFKNSWLIFLKENGDLEEGTKMQKDFSWFKLHKKCMDDFLEYLFQRSDQHILKGGSALMYCYNLQRRSEDLDFNCYTDDLLNYVVDFCNIKGFQYNVKKDTDFKKRILINYGGTKKFLKIECALMDRDQYFNKVVKINNILTFDLNTMLKFKIKAYLDRYKLRDIYDISFLVLNYIKDFDSDIIADLKTALKDKGGLDNIEYLINCSEEDDLLYKDEVINISLRLFDLLGID